MDFGLCHGYARCVLVVWKRLVRLRRARSAAPRRALPRRDLAIGLGWRGFGHGIKRLITRLLQFWFSAESPQASPTSTASCTPPGPTAALISKPLRPRANDCYFTSNGTSLGGLDYNPTSLDEPTSIKFSARPNRIAERNTPIHRLPTRDFLPRSKIRRTFDDVIFPFFPKKLPLKLRTDSVALKSRLRSFSASDTGSDCTELIYLSLTLPDSGVSS